MSSRASACPEAQGRAVDPTLPWEGLPPHSPGRQHHLSRALCHSLGTDGQTLPMLDSKLPNHTGKTGAIGCCVVQNRAPRQDCQSQ